ncbi:MAG: ATP-dependent RNA helicase HrpA [Candidatus Brocadiae bacterium]|nr:ATP-dependent RNA helicase HrpA [Candidatus Brocadiia bacterium]
MLEKIIELEKKIPLCLRKKRVLFQERLAHCKASLEKGQKKLGFLHSLEQEMENSVAEREARLQSMPLVRYPKALPILEKKLDIVKAIQENQVVVIAGETGSGKTTQLPKMCLEAGLGKEGKIGCTQPRRIAATSIARYLKEDLDDTKQKVSYKIRFDNNDTDKALIKLMTDGILLSEIQSDKTLQEYDAIIIDEAHERSLNIDFILGYLKTILVQRPDLKVIISSATIDTQSFAQFFGNAPVIEVSGRMYPVTVYYHPIDIQQEEEGEVTIIDSAIENTRFLFEADDSGDVLIFMPGESDIRETVERLNGAAWCNAVILPLFGRLTAAEQNLIFHTQKQRRVIVSTNIAETSLTIPGIRYVIDTGYARISRYSPRSKTKRLPIENISQSSANQRKGRCGRVEDGVCIRLYSEENYESRDKFSTPEIRRSDLAEVILRMAALNMGDIETFPFVDPPPRSAIKDGLHTLLELGAMTEGQELTPLGKEMASIPTDPRTARILLSALDNNALWEVLVIIAGLSIQDPRERPFEKVEKADECHKSFMDKNSDFLTFLNVWMNFHETWEILKTQNKLRKFCHQNFLSYTRMREWCDLYDELEGLLKDQNKLKFNDAPASYESIHKSILSGYLSHICQRKEKNLYYARQNQEVMLFPGSSQFNVHPEWVVCAELVETSRLFARTVAKIEPDWIEPLAKNLVKYSYENPRWNAPAGFVNATEKVSLWGLTIVPGRSVHYGAIDRKKSRYIMIRDGLVTGQTRLKFAFLQANLELIQSIKNMENKIRKHNFLEDSAVLELFYEERLPDIVSITELKDYLREHPDDRFLRMSSSDILRENCPDVNEQDFPDSIMLGSEKLRLSYVFDPESQEDGVTLHIPLDLLLHIPWRPFTWVIPGWLETKILEILKSLNKDLRRRLTPISDKAREIYENIPKRKGSLISTLQQFIQENYGIKVQEKDWNLEEVPTYLFFRFVVEDEENRVMASSRDVRSLQKTVQRRKVHPLWHKAYKDWFLPNLRNWCFGNLPESVNISQQKGGLQYLGYPGLQCENGKVNRTLFMTLEESEKETRIALRLLLEYSLLPDWSRMERSLELQYDLSRSLSDLGWSKDFVKESLYCLKNASFPPISQILRSESEFQKKREEVQKEIANMNEAWPALLLEIVTRYREIRQELKSPSFQRLQGYAQDAIRGIQQDLHSLFPAKRLLVSVPLDLLQRYPRYLKAIHTRLVRAKVDFAKDYKKWQEIAPHYENLQKAQMSASQSNQKSLVEEYRWMIEEFKVSLFAQELKTAQPVSAKKLEQKWLEIQETLAI